MTIRTFKLHPDRVELIALRPYMNHGVTCYVTRIRGKIEVRYRIIQLLAGKAWQWWGLWGRK